MNALQARETTPEAHAAFVAMTKAIKPPEQLRVVGLHDFIGDRKSVV